MHALPNLEYAEGSNLILERRSAESKFERFSEIVREFISIKTDVIVTVTDPMTKAAKEVTQARCLGPFCKGAKASDCDHPIISLGAAESVQTVSDSNASRAARHRGLSRTPDAVPADDGCGPTGAA